MSDQFEKLIRDSAPELPDPGEYRRLNRVALRERLHEMEKPKRSHSLVVATACLALMVLFSGQISELGSNDFAMDQEERTDLLGNPTTIYKQKVGTVEFNRPSHFSDDDLHEFNQAMHAEDYETTEISCLTVNGNSQWTKNVIMEISGKPELSSRWVDDYPSGEFTDEMNDFYQLHLRGLLAKVKELQPSTTDLLEADGLVFQMEYWKLTYPDFGEVTYAKGIPVGVID